MLRFTKGKLFWVVVTVLVVAVSLTAQAPKGPSAPTASSEMGRYAFWSASQVSGELKWGFLDSKRGRVWIYDPEKEFLWKYSDLNDDAIVQYALERELTVMNLVNGLIKEGKDTTGVRQKLEKALGSVSQFQEEIKQKER